MEVRIWANIEILTGFAWQKDGTKKLVPLYLAARISHAGHGITASIDVASGKESVMHKLTKIYSKNNVNKANADKKNTIRIGKFCTVVFLMQSSYFIFFIDALRKMHLS